MSKLKLPLPCFDHLCALTQALCFVACAVRDATGKRLSGIGRLSDESAWIHLTVVEYLLSFHVVICGWTNAIHLQNGFRVCFFHFPLQFGVSPTRFLHIEPRRLMESPEVTEFSVGTIPVLAALFKCLQSIVLLSLCCTRFVSYVSSEAKHMSPAADSCTTMSHVSSNVSFTSAR